MTPEQLLIIIGTIYLAPYVGEKLGLMAGMFLISIATVTGLVSYLLRF